MYEKDKVIYNLEECESIKNTSYFSQFNTYKNFKLVSKKSGISLLDTSICGINIHDIKLIDTIECISLEDEEMTGKKLILVGDINTNIRLENVGNVKRNRRSTKKNILELKIPFSTFIQMPRGVKNGDKINLKYLIQDITSSILDNNNLFISVTAIISYDNNFKIR